MEREREILNSQKTESSRNQVTLNGNVSKMKHFGLNKHVLLMADTNIKFKQKYEKQIT